MSPLAFGIGKSRGAAFDAAVFDCNYLQFYWWWTDGKDFDVRSEFLKPTALAGQVVGTNKQPHIIDAGGSITYMKWGGDDAESTACLLYTSPSPRDNRTSRMPSSA